MDPDDPVCLCFHVSRRKVIRFIRIEKPTVASQLSECFGAGTGCGWCRPYLKRLLAKHSTIPLRDQADSAPPPSLDEMDFEQYQQARSAYRQQKQQKQNNSEENEG